MQKVADLHIHTNLSDGSLSPQDAVKYAKDKGLCAIAITDHDCCLGIGPAVVAGEYVGLEVIPGVELSAEMDDESMHILGYFVDWKDKIFLDRLAKIEDSRRDRAKKILEKLRGHGIELSIEELFDISGVGSVGRLHIAQLLLRRGFISSIQEAFIKYIGNDGPCYVKNLKISPKEAIQMIKGVGGVGVLAHPSTIGIKDKSIEDIIAVLVSHSLEGIEVYHPDHTSRDEAMFKDIAETYNLLITGGSDCHGLEEKGILIGKVNVAYELVEKLRAAAKISK